MLFSVAQCKFRKCGDVTLFEFVSNKCLLLSVLRERETCVGNLLERNNKALDALGVLVDCNPDNFMGMAVKGCGGPVDNPSSKVCKILVWCNFACPPFGISCLHDAKKR